MGDSFNFNQVYVVPQVASAAVLEEERNNVTKLRQIL